MLSVVVNDAFMAFRLRCVVVLDSKPIQESWSPDDRSKEPLSDKLQLRLTSLLDWQLTFVGASYWLRSVASQLAAESCADQRVQSDVRSDLLCNFHDPAV